MKSLTQKRFTLLSLGLIFILVAAGCPSPHVVHIGSPYERFDHNRTLKFQWEQTPQREPGKPLKINEKYYRLLKPQSIGVVRESSTRVPAADGLHAGHIVPIFNGIPLPLSKNRVGPLSDWEDLIDFLAAGPNAQAGIKVPELSGDREQTEKLYLPVLQLLASAETLRGGRKQMMTALEGMKVKFADQVADSRYRMRTFDEWLGFRFENFWFVLFSIHKEERFSRLVVVPERIKEQPFGEMRPSNP